MSPLFNVRQVKVEHALQLNQQLDDGFMCSVQSLVTLSYSHDFGLLAVITL